MDYNINTEFNGLKHDITTELKRINLLWIVRRDYAIGNLKITVLPSFLLNGEETVPESGVTYNYCL